MQVSKVDVGSVSERSLLWFPHPASGLVGLLATAYDDPTGRTARLDILTYLRTSDETLRKISGLSKDSSTALSLGLVAKVKQSRLPPPQPALILPSRGRATEHSKTE